MPRPPFFLSRIPHHKKRLMGLLHFLIVIYDLQVIRITLFCLQILLYSFNL
jgi:hypothetical protein